MLKIDMVATGQEVVREKKIKVREMSEKIGILKKSQGKLKLL